MSRKVQIVNMEAAESERDVVVTTHDGTVHTIRPGRTLEIETGDVIGVSYRSLIDQPLSAEETAGFEDERPFEDGESQKPVEPGPENPVDDPVGEPVTTAENMIGVAPEPTEPSPENSAEEPVSQAELDALTTGPIPVPEAEIKVDA